MSSVARPRIDKDDVTIARGQFAEGTPMAVSYMRLKLDHRYGALTEEQRACTRPRRRSPTLLRRDFNTVDGGGAGLHFVSV